MNKPFAIGEILQVKRNPNSSNLKRSYYLVIGAATDEQPLKIQLINSSAKYKAEWACIPLQPEEDLERTSLKVKELQNEEVVVHEQLYFEYVIGKVAKVDNPESELQFVPIEGGWQSTEEVYFSTENTFRIKGPVFLKTPNFDED
jgi:hypothetical protein